MKNFLYFLILIFLSIAISAFWYKSHRYDIKSPMQDIEYKKIILEDANNWTYTLEALRPVMGPEELTEFLKSNDKNSQIYTPSETNIKNGNFKANLHMHTINSDGMATVEERMNDAQAYAEKNIKDGYMVIAITDHNTVLGAQDVIKVLEKNKGKYNKLKVILGIEIYTEYRRSEVTKEPIQIHVLTWCINPFDEYLNNEFYKPNLNDKWNRTIPDRDFDWVIDTMSVNGIVGIAHPARYIHQLKDKKYKYITEMLERYEKLNHNTLFAEGYYQSYPYTGTKEHLGNEYEKLVKYINDECERLKINRSGSTDAHGKSIFTK